MVTPCLSGTYRLLDGHWVNRVLEKIHLWDEIFMDVPGLDQCCSIEKEEITIPFYCFADTNPLLPDHY